MFAIYIPSILRSPQELWAYERDGVVHNIDNTDNIDNIAMGLRETVSHVLPLREACDERCARCHGGQRQATRLLPATTIVWAMTICHDYIYNYSYGLCA